MVGVIYVYVDTVYGFYEFLFSCLVGCFSMIAWTPAVLSVLYACALFCFGLVLLLLLLFVCLFLFLVVVVVVFCTCSV